MRLITTVIPMALTMLASTNTNAAETERYRLEKTDTGYVRMDTQTGEMSICEERDGQLICKLATDMRTAFEGEVERLQDAVTALEERIAKLEAALPAKPQSALPTEEEFEKTMGYMERFLRRFMGIAKDMEEESKTPGTQQAPEPNKT
ncbi:hypothetical protein EET67_04515 [Pseudaminobacter arsenicus]|uniref:Uncharacterized protein n=1 Tax=Borborobacter arsenicus TaxID=1851146 RepID=A0A432V9U2_9HYPH|nr:hypothetical protein [Pseudaminobacter arsenicus]RUM98914.1 hypothetical protein EET67_04515 [Pseudaminobacter arsenicus]